MRVGGQVSVQRRGVKTLVRPWRALAAGAVALSVVGCYFAPSGEEQPQAWPGPVISGACTVERLGFVAGTGPTNLIEIEGIDPTGRYVVGHQWSAAGGHFPVRWDRGVAQRIDLGTSGSAVRVNSQGWTVGWSDNPAVGWMLVADETVTPLPLPDGYSRSEPVDINERGDILGSVTKPSAHFADYAVWSSGPDGALIVRLLAKPAPDSGVRGIADDGTVLGVLVDDDPSEQGSLRGQPYIWEPDGSGHELAPPEGVRFRNWMSVAGVWGLTEADNGKLARWNVRTDEVSFVDHVNASGTLGMPVVSSRGVAYSGRPAVLLIDGRAYELPFPADLGGSNWIARVAAITPNGTVVTGVVQGRAQVGDETYPVVWRCSPSSQ